VLEYLSVLGERCKGKGRSSSVAAKVGWRRQVSWGKDRGEEEEVEVEA